MRWRRSGTAVSRAAHDRLLDTAAPPSASGPDDPLAGLLRAAAAPPRDHELAGEQAALAAFRAARQGAAPVTSPSVRPRRRRFTAGAVAWIAGVAATATAGAALAAVNLDRPEPPPVPPATSAPAETSAPATPTPSETRPDTTADPTGSTSASVSPSPTVSPTGSPSPSETGTPEASAYGGPLDSGHTGHCRSYLSKSERQREKAMDSPGFADLRDAAGGAENVAAYCRALLAEVDPDWLAKHGTDPDDTPATG
ncbi:hypothetical protein ACIBO1_17710 [Micromonospora sp. NPDC049903]|uniref:hypothetical protein n=1 Tax=Micromonospora sp. NPDC049903 TaxID=3364276 RepID=UPI00379642F2